MHEILLVIIPSLITGIGAWLYNKTPKGKIESWDMAAKFYQNLLDDATRRLDESILAIKERDERILKQDKRIEELLDQVEHLTDELKKFKQLNGKP